MKRILLLLVITLWCIQLNAQSVAHERCAALGKGMNISNWLERGWDSNWPTANGYTKSDLEKMKEAGVQSLRLPVTFARVVDSVAPYYVDTNHIVFQRIDSVIQWADELQMNVIIDNHHEWTLANDNWRNQLPRFAHVWGTIAHRYQHLDPNRYTFELLNEPAILFALDSLNIMFNTAIDSIRKYTTVHTIIVSPNVGSMGMSFASYRPLADTNLIYTWHCYDPLDFTHQGFAWHNPFYPAGTVFPGTPASFYEELLYNGVAHVMHWKDTFNLPVFLGEFGVSEHADAASRCNWIEFVGNKLDENNIPWFYWDWRWDFSMFNSHIVSADSVLPCFKHALHLYGDTLVSDVVNHKQELPGVTAYPTLIAQGGNFHVQVKDADAFQLKIMDASGRLVETFNSNGTDIKVPVNLESGFYLVQVCSGNRTAVVKVLVQHL